MGFLLRTNSRGPQVKKLQLALNFLEASSRPLQVDGIFGPKTRAATITFQTKAKLTAAGLAKITLLSITKRKNMLNPQ
jgi:peptidoglycan hydrolase-like protein with peptidoglycan-binding domain